MREGGDLVVNLDVLDVRVILEVFHLFATDAKGGELLLAADVLDLAVGSESLGLVEAVIVLVLDDEVDPTVGITGVWGTRGLVLVPTLVLVVLIVVAAIALQFTAGATVFVGEAGAGSAHEEGGCECRSAEGSDLHGVQWYLRSVGSSVHDEKVILRKLDGMHDMFVPRYMYLRRRAMLLTGAIRNPWYTGTSAIDEASSIHQPPVARTTVVISTYL